MGVTLCVDGRTLTAVARTKDRISFQLTLPAREVRLLSGSARPAELDGKSDTRRLGIRVLGLHFEQDGDVFDMPIRSGTFVDGFHALEEDSYRWTNGNALLPEILMPAWRGDVLLHVRMKEWVGSDLGAGGTSTASLFDAFDSIGTNCDFAYAQRRFNASAPAGLLSWSGIRHAPLLRALEQQFSGVGDPTVCTLFWRHDEYMLRTPYFLTHTHYQTQVDEKALAGILETTCARLRLLRRKLLKDIAEARRIFIYKPRNSAVGLADMIDLHTALRRIGPASLLCVTAADPDRPAGTVEPMADGLYIGRLSTLETPPVLYDEWYVVCERTLALHRSGQ